MAENAQDKEFKTFGIKGWARAGMLIGILTLSLSANVTLFFALQRSKDDNIRIQQEATKQVIEILRPDLNQIQSSVNSINQKVDTATRVMQQANNKMKQP